MHRTLDATCPYGIDGQADAPERSGLPDAAERIHGLGIRRRDPIRRGRTNVSVTRVMRRTGSYSSVRSG